MSVSEPTPAAAPATPIAELAPAVETVRAESITSESAAPPVEPEASVAFESKITPLQEQAPQESSPPGAQTTFMVSKRGWSADDRNASAAKRVQKKEATLAKVMDLARDAKRITNDDIVRKIHVSDKSASRYAKILVERGLLKREGRGRGAAYVSP